MPGGLPFDNVGPVPRGCHTLAPRVVALTGAWLKSLTLHPLDAPLPGLAVVLNGLAPSTRRRHQLNLWNLYNAIANSPTRDGQPLVFLLLEHLLFLQHARGWQPQTLLREAHFYQGAFAQLSQYSNWPFPVHLQEDPAWNSALRHLRQMSEVSQPTGQSAVELEDISQILAAEPSELVRSFIMLEWVTACRSGDTRALRAKDVTLATAVDINGNFPISVQFALGKAAKLRGPYTVHSAVPPEWAAEIREHLRQNPTGPLFPTRVARLTDARKTEPLQARVLAAIRAAGSHLSTRSMRRGALQSLAKSLGAAGVSQADALTQLMAFSGHTNEKTLKRYLDWGRLFAAGAREGAQAAAAGLIRRH